MWEPDHKYIAALVIRAQKNDQDAFTQLYNLTYNRVYNYARHYLRDDYLAQDALQEVYISVLRNLNKIKDPTLFIAWLNQICFHVCYDLTKKMNPLSQSATEDALLEAIRDDRPFSNPEDRAVADDSYRHLAKALETIPVNERQCIIMKYYNNMKLDDIASATGFSKSTVKRYIASGEKALRRLMGM